MGLTARRRRDGLAHIAERLIDGEGKGRDCFVLIETGDHRALTAVRLQVLGEGGEKLVAGRSTILRGRCAGRRPRGEGGGKCGNFAGTQAKTVSAFMPVVVGELSTA